MLGEAALTAADAARYLRRLRARDPRDRRGAPAGAAIHAGPGISVKLSALHPRYARAQRARVHGELLPAAAQPARCSRARYDIGLNIDAEEADRLELSLDLLERLCRDPALAGWNGLGFVVQAYQKRCPAVIDWLVDLARRSGRRLMVRLVKGAYWDSEIKRAQVDGLAGYPVFTRKVHTDVVLPRLRAPAARRARRGLSRSSPPTTRTRSPRSTQLAGARCTPDATSSSACTAWASRSTTRSSAQATAARPAVPHLRAGRHARDAARLPGAPAARERRQHLVRQPHRRSRACRSRSWSPIRSQRARWPSATARGRRTRASRCRATLFGAERAQFARARPRRRAGAAPRWRARWPRSAAQPCERRAAARRPAQRAGAAPVSQPRRPARRRRQRASRPTAADVAAALAAADAAAPALGRDAGRPSAPRASSAPPTRCEAQHAAR